MKRLMLAALTASTLSLFASSANAQLGTPQRPFIGSGTRPPSPFSNVMRGSPLGPAYTPLPRSQLDALRALGGAPLPGLVGDPTGLTTPLGGLPPNLGITGHPVTYFNYGPFYTFPSPKFGPTSAGGFGGAGGNLADILSGGRHLGYPRRSGVGGGGAVIGIRTN
jgi:hypothetical protein